MRIAILSDHASPLAVQGGADGGGEARHGIKATPQTLTVPAPL